MNSIQFPKMFNSSSTNIVENSRDASLQNLKLLLGSEKGEFFGDPFFGIRLKRYVFEQNNYVLRDILVDEIYSQLLVFMPQLTVQRKDIKITSVGQRIIVSFKAINNLDFTTNMYELALFEGEQK